MNDKYRACYEDLTIAAHRAYTRGLQTGSGGNLSVKIPEEHGMIVKNSGGSFADCDAKGNGWVAMNFDGTLKEGEVGKPTREWMLHGVLLEHLEDCNAVVHTHSPYTIAWADKHKDRHEDFFCSENAVMMHIANLRNKLNWDNVHLDFIKTCWGRGYQI